MKPGRELDALVAEKVMGLEVITTPERYAEIVETNDGDFFGKKYVATCLCHNQLYDRFRGRIATVPPYSASIAAAWEVVEKIHKSTFNWSEGSRYWDGKQTNTDLQLALFHEKGGWSARFMDMQNNTFCMAEGQTAPHAICLVALRAVGVEL